MNVEKEHFAPSEEDRPGCLENGDILTLTERKLCRKKDDKKGSGGEQI